VEKEIQASLIGAAAGLVGVLVGGLITWLITRTTNRVQRQMAETSAHLQQRTFIDGLLLKMIEFQIEHPHLEKKELCHSYPAMSGHPNAKERYESYCCFAFNVLMMAFNHFGQDLVKLREYVHLDEIVYLHHKWWLEDRENLAYDEPFQACVQSCINKLKKEGKI
jgi:hypothetical protein